MLKRYLIELSYLGTNYHGWQVQPNAVTVQQLVQDTISKALSRPVEVVGCGRTDTGVHARQYFVHFDSDVELGDQFVRQLNFMLPADIRFLSVSQQANDFHSRFDADFRSYKYYLNFKKDPFREGQSYFFPWYKSCDEMLVREAAALLMEFDSFLPFCKTNNDLENYNCTLMESSWDWRESDAIYTISANRFLRGMVRLVVGMCLNTGMGKISLDAVRFALQNQSPLERSWSVPADGLFLEKVRYPMFTPSDTGAKVSSG